MIIAILAAAAQPIIRARVDSAKWSEGKAVMGTIATALRAYLAVEGSDYVATPTLVELGVAPGSLDGTYFSGGDSGSGDFSWVINDDNPVDFLVTATAPDGMKNPSMLTLDAARQWTATP